MTGVAALLREGCHTLLMALTIYTIVFIAAALLTIHLSTYQE